MSRHEVSENLIERSLQIQEKIDLAEKHIENMDIKALLDMGMIDRRAYQNWIKAEDNEQDLVDTHGQDYNPSLQHYYTAMDVADKNIKRLKKEVDNLIAKSRYTLRQASRVADRYMSKTAGSGVENARYLESLTPKKKMEILKHIADHYGVSVREIEEELVDQDAEKLFEYAASNNAMAMEIYQGMSRMANTKTAASGNYGFTKRVQSDVEVALRKLQKKVDQLARSVENKHPEAGSYFGIRCQGIHCNASKVLSKACLLNQAPKRVLSGPLGYKPTCARAAHKAITDLTLHAGEVAHSLYQKNRDHIPYLQVHAKKKRCPLTKLILENYPVEIL